MSWFNKISPVVAAQNRRIEELESELKRYADALAKERDKIKSMQDASRSANFFFDFNSVNAFSVERNVGNDGVPVTIIGYTIPVVSDGKETFAIKEWYLHCDETQHELVIKAFKDSRK